MALQGDIVEVEQKKRRIYSDIEGEVDEISKLTDDILLCILKFLTTKEAIQTCILSKRWKDLWKSLPSLTTNGAHFRTPKIFNNFVSKFLVHRVKSSALHNISIQHNGYVQSQMLDKLMKYATSHNVEKFKLRAYICCYSRKDIVLSFSMFPCHSLTSLDLSLSGFNGKAILPKVLDFPELKDCRLKDVAFSLTNNDCAQPFSSCKELSTLVIDSCTLHEAQVLCVCSDKLANLTIRFDVSGYHPCKVQISTPNLNSFAFVGPLTTTIGDLFEHKLEFLEKVSIDASSCETSLKIVETLKSWLKKFSNVNSMTISSLTLKVLSWIPAFPNIEPIGFSNLMSLKVKREPHLHPQDEVLNYILQDSPLAEVTITEGPPHFFDELDELWNIDDLVLRKRLMRKKMETMRKNMKM